MMALTDAFALFGITAALCAGAAYLCRLRGNNVATQPFGFGGWTKAWISVLFVAMLVPIPGTGVPFAGYVRGFIGDLSITLMALSILALCHRLFGAVAISRRELTALLVVVGTAAFLLYPTALGWGDWDAYRLGWGSWWILSVLLLLTAACAWMGLRVLPAMVALALLAWSLELLESGNLWDYLLDPWLSAYALGFVFIKFARIARKRFANRSSH